MLFRFFRAFAIGAMAIASAQTPDPRSLVLVGDRFKPLKYDEMTAAQKTMIDHLASGERRGAGGPFQRPAAQSASGWRNTSGTPTSWGRCRTA